MPRLTGIGTLRPWRRQPVAEQLGRLVGTLQGARDHRPAAGAAGGDVLGGHHDRGRAHQHRLAQVLREADLAGLDVGAGDERRVRRRHLVHELDEARVALVGALVERVLAHHVGGGEQEQLRLRVARERLAALVGARALVRGAIGAVRLVRSGRRLVPENFGHDVLLSFSCVVVLCDGSGQGTERTSGAESNGDGPAGRFSQEGSPSFAADRRGEIGLGTRAAEDAVQCSAH